MFRVIDKVITIGIFSGIAVGDFIGLFPSTVNVVVSDLFLLFMLLRYSLKIRIPMYFTIFLLMFFLSQTIDIVTWYSLSDKFFTIDESVLREFVIENVKFFIALLYLIIGYNLVKFNSSNFEKGLKIFPYLLLAESFVAIILWKLGYYPEAFSPRFRAFVPNQNYLAITLNTGLAIFLYFSEKIHFLKKLFITILFFMLIFLTGSRGGIITFFVILSFSFIFISGNTFKRIIFAVVFLLSSVGIVLLTINFILPHISKSSEIIRRLSMTLYIEKALEKSHRIDAFSFALKAIDETSLLGIGKGLYLTWTQYEFGQRILAHNTYLQIMAENGLLGILAWISLFVLNLKNINKSKLIIILPIFIASFSTSLDKYRLFWLLLPYIFVKKT